MECVSRTQSPGNHQPLSLEDTERREVGEPSPVKGLQAGDSAEWGVVGVRGVIMEGARIIKFSERCGGWSSRARGQRGFEDLPLGPD